MVAKFSMLLWDNRIVRACGTKVRLCLVVAGLEWMSSFYGKRGRGKGMQQTFTTISLIYILTLESSKSFPQVALKPLSCLWSPITILPLPHHARTPSQNHLPLSSMSDDKDKIVYVPDTMSDWPWPAKLNPLCDEVEAESIAWLTSLKLHTPESFDAHNEIRAGRLAAYSYPDAPHGTYYCYISSPKHLLTNGFPLDRLRIGTDIVHMLFIIDEYTDMEPTAGVHEISDIILDALHNPDKPRPEGELSLGEMVRQ